MLGILNIQDADIVDKLNSESLSLCLIPSGRLKYKQSEFEILKDLFLANIDVIDYDPDKDPKTIIAEYIKTLPKVIQDILNFKDFTLTSKENLYHYLCVYPLYNQQINNPIYPAVYNPIYDFKNNVPILNYTPKTITFTDGFYFPKNSACLYLLNNTINHNKFFSVYFKCKQNTTSTSSNSTIKNIFQISLNRSSTQIRAYIRGGKLQLQINGAVTVTTYTWEDILTREMKITFFSDETFIIYSNNLIVYQGTYTMTTNDYNMIALTACLNTNSSLNQINGDITLYYLMIRISNNDNIINYQHNLDTSIFYIDYELQKKLISFPI